MSQQPLPIILRQHGERRSLLTSTSGSNGPATSSTAASSATSTAASSSAVAAAASAAAHAPPTAFSSRSHDEFGQKTQAKDRANQSSSAASASSQQRTTIYRSPLTSRPLLRTLQVVLHALIGQTIRIELKNDTCVSGKLNEVDRAGNLLMQECQSHRNTASYPNGSSNPVAPIKYASMFLPGRGIRYVHLPARLDVRSLVTRFESGMDDRLLQYRRKKRQGKFTTREEQEKKIDQKERKLAEDIRREREAEATAAASTHTDTSSGERDAKRQKLDSSSSSIHSPR